MSSTGRCGSCGAEARLKCASCQKVFYCCKEHQKKHWKQHKTICKPFTVEESSQLGRYLTANKDFKPGDVIIKNSPIVLGPPWCSIPICLGCYKAVDGSYRCSKCNFPLCEPKCEQMSYHHFECSLIQEKGLHVQVNFYNEPHPLYQPIFVLRCLLLKQKDKEKWEQLMKMESHLKDREQSALHQEEKQSVVDVLKNFYKLADFTDDDIHGICGIIDVNALEIKLADCEIMGLFKDAVLMEHNCSPNTKHSFNNDFSICVRAATQIQKDEHISTMYTNTLWATHAREDHLKCFKYFLCSCDRCKDPTELGTELGTLICRKEDKGVVCGGLVRSTDPTNESADWTCEQCKAIVPAAAVVQQNFAIGERVESLQARPDTSIEDYEQLLASLQTLVHNNHYQLFTLKHSLLQMYGRNGKPLKQLHHKSLQRKVDLCEQVLRISKKLDPGCSRLNIYSAVTLLELHLAYIEQLRRGNKSREMVTKAHDCLNEAHTMMQDSCSNVEIQMQRVVQQKMECFQKWLKESNIK